MLLNADWAIAGELQRPLADGALAIVARGGKLDQRAALSPDVALTAVTQ